MKLFDRMHPIDRPATVPAEDLQRMVVNCRSLIDVRCGLGGGHVGARGMAGR